jgi:ribonuclease-3
MSDQQDERLTMLAALTDRLEISATDLTLVNQALTHASISSEKAGTIPHYESLEFLGDAALGLAIAHHLFADFPDRTPGEYSRMRASLVNRRTLARIATQIDIAPAIRLGKGEEQAGGRQREALLADCLEALIGAVYLDAGWDATRAFIERIFAEDLGRTAKDGLVWDFKSRLQHYCQAERVELPTFTVVRSEGPDHQKEFEVEVALRGSAVGRGIGASKKEAEQNAARAALEHENQFR